MVRSVVFVRLLPEPSSVVEEIAELPGQVL